MPLVTAACSIIGILQRMRNQAKREESKRSAAADASAAGDNNSSPSCHPTGRKGAATKKGGRSKGRPSGRKQGASAGITQESVPGPAPECAQDEGTDAAGATALQHVPASGAAADALTDDAGVAAAAVNLGANDDKADQTAGLDLQIEQPDAQPSTASGATDAASKGRKARGTKEGKSAAAGLCGNDIEDPAGVATGSRKRPTAASGGWSGAFRT